MADMEVVFKKVCSYAQPQNLVYVKQLLIVREDGKKYLMLRLVNERAERVSAVTVSVVSYDGSGREIGTKQETLAVSGETDKPFVPETKILLSDNACDCKASVVAADYGDYRYRADGKNIVVDYKTEKQAKPQAVVSPKKMAKAGKDGVAVSRRTLKAPLLVIVGMFVALALALIAVYAHTLYFVAHEKTFLYSGIEYAFENDDKSDGTNIYVVGYNGNRARVVIPEYIEGHRVTHIATGAFRNNDSMTSISFEASIPIEDFAFENCKALRTVEFDNVTEIGVGAFKGCTQLREVVIPDGITIIPREAFYGCRSLETVSVPQSEKLIKIGQNAFGNCASLRDVDVLRRIDYSYNAGKRDYFTGSTVRRLHIIDFDTTSDIFGNDHISSLFGKTAATSVDDVALGELVIDRLPAIPVGFCSNLAITKFEVRSIDNAFVSDNAFYGCSNLKEFKLPVGTSVTGVGAYAFYGTALTGFNGIAVETLGTSAFENCTALTSVSFSGNVVLSVLGESAFMDCTALTNIRYANAAIINEIGDSAFKNCSSLSAVTFPGDTLSAIRASAFEGCSALSGINLPETVVTVSEYAFKDCTALTAFTVPDGVVRMGRGVFAGCSGLASLTVPFVGEMPEMNNYLAYMFGADNRYYTANTFVPSSLTSVTVTTANSVGICAFNLCANISEINLPETVTDIGESAFNGCTALTEFALPSSVTSVGRGAFAGCTSISTLTVPFVGGSRESNAFLSYMFGSSFYEDGSVVPQSLTTVIVTDAARIGMGAFYDCEYLQNISLPETVLFVDSGAFAGCAAITELVIPNSVQTVGANAFSGMISLHTLSVPFVGATRAGVYDYRYEDATYKLGYFFEDGIAPRSLKKLAITDSSYIGAYAFYNCLFLEQVELDCEIEGVGMGAFDRCFKLYEVFNYGGTRISKGSLVDAGGIARYALKVHTDREEQPLPQAEADGFRYVCDDDSNWYLIDCDTSVEQALLPTFVSAGAYSFSEYALWQYIFYGCDKLVGADIPANVTAVGNGAFSNCTALTRISYASGSRVTEIGDETFDNCYKLYDLNLPENITRYGTRAFYNCSRIKRIIVPRGMTASDIGEYAFYNCSRLFEVINLSDLDIYSGDVRFGYVAAYAASVSSSLLSRLDSVITADGVHYMALNNNGIRYWAVDYYGTDGDLSLTPFTAQGSAVTRFGVFPGAFYSYDYITNMTVGYDSIVNVTVSTAVDAIRTDFLGCENIQSVSFVGGGVGTFVTLGASAFMSARNSLQSVSSTVSLVFDGEDIFPTDKLASVRFDARIANINTRVFAPAVYADEPVQMRVSLADVGNIQSDAFGGTASLYSVTASGTVDRIMSGAFNGCSNLNTVSFGNVGAIESFGIAYTGATSMTFGNVDSISDYAFVSNSSLASVTLGDVSTFGSYIFSTPGSYYESLAISSITAGDVGTICNYAFYNLPSLTSATFAQVDNIGDYAFAYDYSLNRFAISTPATTLYIGERAFASTGLTSFSYTGRIGTLEDYAFANCGSLTTVNLDRVDFLGSNDSYSGGYVFADCSLDSVTISGNITTIGRNAFAGAAIVDLTFNGSVGTIGEYAFGSSGSSGRVVNVTFGSSIVTIGNYAFYGWAGQTVTFGGSLSTMGEYAFAYCAYLEEITLPDSLAEIKMGAFAGCNNLHKVTLPRSLRTLADSAFNESLFLFVVYNRSSSLSNATVTTKLDHPILVTNDSSKTTLAYYTDNSSGVKFVKVDGSWYAYDMPYAGYTITMLPDSFTVNGENVTSYTIRAYASRGVNNSYSYDGNYWYVPTSVRAIQDEAFTYVFQIYYRGTQTQWNNIYSGGNATIILYCYKACVHEGDDGYWRFDSINRPTINRTEWEFSGDDWRTTTQSTCTVNGVATATCPHCNRTFTQSLGYAPHNIVSGECTVCHARETMLTSENMNSIGYCRIVNDPTTPFTVGADGKVVSSNTANYSSSSFTITATKRMTVTFTASVVSQSYGDYVEIYFNDSLYGQVDRYGGGYTYTYDLEAGDSLRFTFRKDGINNGNGQEYGTISNLTFICSEDTQNNA